MGKENLKIVFFGTPEFAVASLEALLEKGYDVATVVTAPDKPGGRGHGLIQSDVKKFALAKGLQLLQPEKLKSTEFIDKLREINADLFIVIAFRMLPEVVWSMPRLGTFNLHASLLPAYRGAAPINRAIMNGETKTGVTTFFLKHEIDTGDVIMQKETEIFPEDNVGTLYERLMKMGAETVVETVSNIERGETETKRQEEGDFPAAPKIFSEDCMIDWTKNVVDIHNQVRGLSPVPGARSYLTDCKTDEQDIAVKVFATKPANLEGLMAEKPGDTLIEGNRLFVKAGDGFIEIKEIQPAGKKRMDAASFLRGYKPIRFKN